MGHGSNPAPMLIWLAVRLQAWEWYTKFQTQTMSKQSQMETNKLGQLHARWSYGVKCTKIIQHQSLCALTTLPSLASKQSKLSFKVLKMTRPKKQNTLLAGLLNLAEAEVQESQLQWNLDIAPPMLQEPSNDSSFLVQQQTVLQLSITEPR